MAGDINAITLVGRITKDSELRYTASGTAIANFSIATNRRIKKNDEWVDEASFINLTLWSKQAEGLNKYLVKGTQVAIQGHLEQHRWEKDGVKHSELRVGVDEIQLLGGKREGQAEAPRKPAQGFDDRGYEPDPPF